MGATAKLQPRDCKRPGAAEWGMGMLESRVLCSSVWGEGLLRMVSAGRNPPTTPMAWEQNNCF